MVNFLSEFKKFIARGNVIDLAVGVVIGMAFQKIVSSLIGDIVFPALSPLLNHTNFSDWTIGPILIGNFIKAVVDFVVVAFFIFLVVKFVNRFKKKEEDKKENEMNRQELLLTEIRDLLKDKVNVS